MRVFTEVLAQRFRTLAPDLRGYGSSRVNQPFSMQTHLVDLEALLAQQGIQRCLILGWSLGGILAMELALQRPDLVSGLILVATAAYPRSSHPPITWQDNLNTGIASLVNRVIPGWQWNITTFGQKSLYRYLIQQHTPEAYQFLATDALPAFLQTSAAAHTALNQALRQRYNRLADLHQIQCPSLVLAGECDRHITAAASQETAEHLPQSRWICYPNTAHLFPWEIPGQVHQDIVQWLETVPEAISP